MSIECIMGILKKKRLLFIDFLIVLILIVIAVLGSSCTGKDSQAEQSHITEQSDYNANRIVHDKYFRYGKIANTNIALKIGKSEELIDIKTISGWLTPEEKGDQTSYVLKDEDVKAYVHSLAEKYNTFKEYYKFMTSRGKEIQLLNKGSGWLMDESYAEEQIKTLALSGESVVIELTDNSEESKKWWTRIAGQYDEKKGHEGSYAEVSIEDQCMWFYNEGILLFSSPVITGNPNTGNDTPTGAFVVTDKKQNAELYGPEYNTEVKYWVGFTYQIGFHDAEWQDCFGGEEYLYNGSHGCVNLPTDIAKLVYEKSFVNMHVYVY